MKNRGQITVVLDSQAGSCGKGKFVGYLAKHDDVDIAINNFMSNAGHTWVSDGGDKVMTQHVPTSIVNEHTTLMIGPGAAITPHILFEEILSFRHLLGNRAIIIHPRAMVIMPKHAEQEKQVIKSGSTFKGCGAAQAEKIMRSPGVQLFGDWWYNTDNWIGMEVSNGDHFTSDGIRRLSCSQAMFIAHAIQVTDTMPLIHELSILNGLDVIVEGSQGCDLDINYGLEYPHTTSRQCHAGQLIADCGIAPRLLDETIMIMRPYPIRISNETNIGCNIYSGGYDGAEEISWDIIKERCGAPSDVEFGEITTVTKKKRRVFEMNWDRLKYVTMLNMPTQIAINFVQYIDYGALYCNCYEDLPQKVKDYIERVEDITGVPVTLIGTGPRDCDIVDLRGTKLNNRRK